MDDDDGFVGDIILDYNLAPGCAVDLDREAITDDVGYSRRAIRVGEAGASPAGGSLVFVIGGGKSERGEGYVWIVGGVGGREDEGDGDGGDFADGEAEGGMARADCVPRGMFCELVVHFGSALKHAHAHALTPRLAYTLAWINLALTPRLFLSKQWDVPWVLS